MAVNTINPAGTFDILGNSEPIKVVRKLITTVAPSNANIIISGESGVGKELVARAIHQNSHRKHMPFIAINCAAFTQSLVESELFGHEKGAFTGALNSKAGCFERADGGTLFLDEIGELPLLFQAKLLRVIQEGEVERVGATAPLQLNLRVICATNRNLEEGIAEGWFRRDLYYRLNIVTITVPPLRQRKSDILLLANHFISKYTPHHIHKRPTLTALSIQVLESYHYPGNVRELSNIIQRALVLSRYGPIRHNVLPDTIANLPENMPSIGSNCGVRFEALLKSLKNIVVMTKLGKRLYWHRGLRCVTVEQIHHFLSEQGQTWFARKLFEIHLKQCANSDCGKYKTAGIYLNILITHNICRHNGKSANKSAYQLHDRYTESGPVNGLDLDRPIIERSTSGL